MPAGKIVLAVKGTHSPTGRKYTLVKKRKYARKGNKRITKIVKDIIHNQVEDKEVDFAGQMFPQAWGCTNFNTQNILPVSPYSSFLSIQQGTGAGGRIGNQIKTRKLMMRFILNSLPYNATTNTLPKPQDVTIYFIKCKDTPVSITSSTGLGAFFQASGSASAPSGNIYDYIKRPNTDVWTICKKIRAKVGFQYYNGTGSDVTNQLFSNNDYKYNIVKDVDLTKYCCKTIKYNDNTTTPVTPTLQMLILTGNADGSGYNAANQTQLQFSYQLYYTYEDS